MSKNSQSGLKGIIKKQSSFFGMWKRCACEFVNGEIRVYRGLTFENVESRIELDKSAIISILPDQCKFKIENINKNGGKEEFNFATESKEETKKWVHTLRSETYKGNSLSMSDFDIISVIGRGYYGKVMLVSKKDTGEKYAIKTIKKKLLQDEGKVSSIISEKNILLKADFPFVVKIKFTFQTDTKFYLGMEYVSGGELFRILCINETLPLPAVRLYIAEIGLALDYLHSVGVIYRDLKTENILLDNSGHVKIVDFGLSKDISPTNETSTFCGTLDYIAPEMVLSKSYDYSIDWWGLGILAYECLFGETPFTKSSDKKTYMAILNDEPYFPIDTEPCVVDFISQLLEKDPLKRATFNDLRNHPFWDNLNFDDVLAKKYTPFYVPNNDRPESNFSSTFTQEPPTDSPATPLQLSLNKSDFGSFSFSEDSSIGLDTKESLDQQPSSILTLELIDTN